MKKILNDLKLKFDNANWALDPELALIDTVLEQHPELFEIVKTDIKAAAKSSEAGRQDSPTLEQIVRAALYKEMKKLNYRELEYAQYDSRVCSTFIKLDGRKPISFEAYYKYISQIKGETLKKFMIEINRIMIKEAAVEDCKSLQDRQYCGGDGHTLSDEQRTDVGLYKDKPSHFEKVRAERLSEESSEQSEAGEEEPISDKQYQERGQKKGALRQSAKTAAEQYQSGREGGN